MAFAAEHRPRNNHIMEAGMRFPFKRFSPWRIVWAAIAIVAVSFAANSWKESRHRAHDKELGYADGGFFWETSFYESGERPQRVILPEFIAFLKPHSRVATGLSRARKRQFATFDGEGTVQALLYDYRVVTATAEMILSRGEYEITSVPGSGATKVRVRSGRATVWSVGKTSGVPRVIGAGEEAVVTL
jgi:hypothetical protein